MHSLIALSVAEYSDPLSVSLPCRPCFFNAAVEAGGIGLIGYHYQIDNNCTCPLGTEECVRVGTHTLH